MSWNITITLWKHILLRNDLETVFFCLTLALHFEDQRDRGVWEVRSVIFCFTEPTPIWTTPASISHFITNSFCALPTISRVKLLLVCASSTPLGMNSNQVTISTAATVSLLILFVRNYYFAIKTRGSMRGWRWNNNQTNWISWLQYKPINLTLRQLTVNGVVQYHKSEASTRSLQSSLSRVSCTTPPVNTLLPK